MNHKYIAALKHWQHSRKTLFIGIFAILGLYLLLNTFAAATTANLQAEEGTKAGVNVGVDASAANGGFIQFGTGAADGIYNDDDIRIGYAGTWAISTGAGRYLDNDHYSATTDSTATFSFSGTQVSVYGAKASHHGIAGISIDNDTEVLADYYSATRADNVQVFQSAVLTAGSHTIRLRVTGTKNAASTGNYITLDRIVVGADSGTPPPQPPPPPSGLRIPLYDTAWYALIRSSNISEIDTYFQYLSSKGYTGVQMSLAGGGATFGRTTTITGQQPDYVDAGGKLRLATNYIAYARSVLDKAEAYHLKIVFMVAWEEEYVCGSYGTRTKNILNTGNAYDYGTDIANAIGNHPAIGYWMFGGDTESCYADASVWANISQGLKDHGANQPIGYHTAKGADSPTLQARHTKHATESWLNILTPQTGQCQSAATSQAQLIALRNYLTSQGLNKPIYSVEMRYASVIGLTPSFCSPRTSVGAAENTADAQAALNAGVGAVTFGHHDRWAWGASDVRDTSVSGGTGFGVVTGSFNTAGEQAYLNVLKQ